MGQHFRTNASLPAVRGGLLALLAAALFGVSTPLVQHFGKGMGALTTACVLYAGAAAASAISRQRTQKEAHLLRSDLPRLFLMAAFGAIIGPVALAWGLQHTSGASASLMLTLEAFFTAVLARLMYREMMGRRVWVAMFLLLAGGVALVIDLGLSGGVQIWGLMAVFLATAAWGTDNTLSRALAERDPSQVVLGKALIGAVATALLAWAFGERLPTLSAAIILLLVGATGYGLSLRFYLLAQRAFGAARTGSVFACAPFIGAAFAIALGDRSGSWIMLAGGALMLIGVALHLEESHGHEHRHGALDHEHAHTHDDGHHDHVHADFESDSHSHRHVHTPLLHKHAHVPDAHHRHEH